MNLEPMRKVTEPGSNEQSSPDADMREEYDLRGGIRGKYIHRLVGPIERDMVPEHAREVWDAEFATHGELCSRPEQAEAKKD